MNYWLWFLLNLRRAPAFLALHPSYVPLLIKRLQFLVTRRYCGRSLPGLGVYSEMTMINAWAIHVLRELDGPWVEDVRSGMAPLVLDIGSNVGQFSRYVKEINPGSRIYSFDPWQEASYYAGLSDCHHQYGLSYRKMKASFYVNKTTASTVRHSPAYKHCSRTVAVKPLDGVELPRGEIILMKVDVDGAEQDVLAGAQQTLKRVKHLLIETLDITAIKRLAPGRTWTTNNCGMDWTGVLLS